MECSFFLKLRMKKIYSAEEKQTDSGACHSIICEIVDDFRNFEKSTIAFPSGCVYVHPHFFEIPPDLQNTTVHINNQSMASMPPIANGMSIDRESDKRRRCENNNGDNTVNLDSSSTKEEDFTPVKKNKKSRKKKNLDGDYKPSTKHK